jgi:hypothetical protein
MGLEYIKSSIDIIVQMKMEARDERVDLLVNEKLKDFDKEGKYDMTQSSVEYDKIIQKLEAEIRNHISVQQQMKLYIESYQTKIEDLEDFEQK